MIALKRRDRTTLEVYGRYLSPSGIELEGKFKDVVAIITAEKSNQATNPAERMRFLESSLITAANITTSRSLCRIVDTLAQYPDYQDRVRAEILAAKEAHGELNFDQLEALPLMDAVIRETLV